MSRRKPAAAKKTAGKWEMFDWLLGDSYHIRGNLRDVRNAIRKGVFHGPENVAKRVALCKAIVVLQGRRGLSDRATLAIVRVVAEMYDQNLTHQE